MNIFFYCLFSNICTLCIPQVKTRFTTTEAANKLLFTFFFLSFWGVGDLSFSVVQYSNLYNFILLLNVICYETICNIMKCELNMIIFHFTRKYGKHGQVWRSTVYCSLTKKDSLLDIQRNDHVCTIGISCARMTFLNSTCKRLWNVRFSCMNN
jgi:hypothetical protein